MVHNKIKEFMKLELSTQNYRRIKITTGLDLAMETKRKRVANFRFQITDFRLQISINN